MLFSAKTNTKSYVGEPLKSTCVCPPQLPKVSIDASSFLFLSRVLARGRLRERLVRGSLTFLTFAQTSPYAVLMAHVAGRREIGVKVSMRAASVDPKNTQHAPLTILWCSLLEATRVYPGGRHGNKSCPHAKIATASPWQGLAREARHSLPGGPRGNFLRRGRELLSWRPPGYTGTWLNLRTPQKSKKTSFCGRPQTDLIRLVSSKLMLWEASRCQGRPF